jgi:imidazolonepropionase-like amidohydrolase
VVYVTGIIETIVKTAHGRGIPVSAHAVRYRNLKIAVDAKVDDIAHIIIDYLPGDCINRMIQRDIYWIPTLEVFQCAVNDGRLPEYIFNEIALNNLQRFVLAGGKVALGTDFSGSQCNFDSGIPFTEIRLMQKSGMTPMQIIVAATKNAAHVCNLGTELGTIEIGKIADLIVVGGNPLDDLGVLSNLLVVIHNGNILYSKN